MTFNTPHDRHFMENQPRNSLWITRREGIYGLLWKNHINKQYCHIGSAAH